MHVRTLCSERTYTQSPVHIMLVQYILVKYTIKLGLEVVLEALLRLQEDFIVTRTRSTESHGLRIVSVSDSLNMAG